MKALYSVYINQFEGQIMGDAVYNHQIMNFAQNIPHIGRLKTPHVSQKVTSKLCGATIIVDLCVENNVVSDFAIEIDACLLGRATASIVAAHIIGVSIAEYRLVSKNFRAMLKGEVVTFPARFADLSALQPLREYKLRHGSILLIFDALDGCCDYVQ
jgi:NifU-like protein involved in Fe-S cluster formation